jgi:macrolide-specific efflux system membrane fusion protein
MYRVAAIGLIVFAVVAVLYLRPPSAPSSEASASAVGSAEVRAERRTLTVSTVAIGTVKPKVGAEVKVGSRLSGVVKELAVSVGDVVETGDLLALLDEAEWQVRVAALEAELDEAQTELAFAESQLARAVALEDTIASFELESTQRNVGVRRAALARIEARLAEAHIQLGYTRITAPVGGTIASVSTYEGETVAASFAAPTFVTIVDLERLEVHAYVDETDVGRVREGQSVVLRIDAFPGHELAGMVAAINPKAELVNNVVNYVAVVDIVGAEQLAIRPEMTARVDFALERRAGVVTVPRSALWRDDGETFVAVRTADGGRKVPVQIGLATPQHVEIVAGLEEGTAILSQPGEFE